MALRAPSDLAADGRRLLRDVGKYLAEANLELDVHEVEILLGCCRALDRLASIRVALDTLETTAPAWSTLASLELRLRTTLRVDLSAILPVGALGEDDKPVSLNSRRAARAGKQRWVNEAERQSRAGWAG